ncbi:MAG TPA: HAD-IA family hydrolase [Clostridiaceae bacterium]|nr:HAD-IA family hydrolase [Clostridiaceae bacterium]
MKYSLIFDMDGVLVDSEPVILEASIRGLSEYGVKASPEDFLPFVGAGEDRFIGGVAEKHGLTYKPEMKKRVYEIYLEIVDSKLKIYEGVTQMLYKLKDKGYKLAIASSADKVKVDANLKVAGISKDIFSAIVYGEIVVNKKPNPEIFLTAAKLMEVNPSDCIVVEDALNGIKAAKSAGMKCIAVTSSFPEEVLRRENPDFIVSNTVDIYTILKKIDNIY